MNIHMICHINIRTFAPFVAGMGSMNYKTFLYYNVVGGLIWVFSLTTAGYFLGALPIIKENFETAIYLIILISLIPPVLEFIKAKREPKPAKATAEETSFEEINKTFKKEHLK